MTKKYVLKRARQGWLTKVAAAVHFRPAAVLQNAAKLLMALGRIRRSFAARPLMSLEKTEFRRRHVIHDPAPCSPVLWIRIQWEAWPRQIRKEEAQPENANP